jgi:hypothetical protein
MGASADLYALVELAGRYPMTNGWFVTVRADWIDVTPECPQGLSYALILQNGNGDRVLGFDNAHAADNSEPGAPFDHEHRANAPGRTFAYTFISASKLISDFFARVESYCKTHGIGYEFEDVLS